MAGKRQYRSRVGVADISRALDSDYDGGYVTVTLGRGERVPEERTWCR